MKTLGYEQPLYILPFGHRGSFVTKLFGWHRRLTPAHSAENRRRLQKLRGAICSSSKSSSTLVLHEAAKPSTNTQILK
jgi:hypothetical protein